MKTKVMIIFGGRSVEHEVSVISGIQAYNNMDTDAFDVIPVYLSKENVLYAGEDTGRIEAYRDIDGLIKRSQRSILVNEGGRVKLVPYPKKAFGRSLEYEIDVVLPVLHGTNVEDGAFQGYLKTLGVPFAGCDVLASALGMDKYHMKAVLKEAGIPLLDALNFTLSDYEDIEGIIGKTEEKYGYPVIVKPVNTGSSVGIKVAGSRGELINAIDEGYKYSSRILIEKAITNLREINCAVLGDENQAEASECEEPLHSDEILSYKDKYQSNEKGGGSKGMAGVKRRIPADIPDELRTRVRELAVRAFKALCCAGVSRIDFLLDGDTGELYFNEINTIPGSLSFYLFEPIGVSYKELLTRLIELALKRDRTEKSLTFTFDTNILSTSALGGSKK